ncbi:hypothetical protein [Xanthocytophaga agilis]|uniref:Uncharacterized protein n=1 Tax=Xanthocytophaga agilis TaxID=3048010 RepID=A0AAE3UGR0_9BACT|nr:hypothetical protein [Xanthocytophaga agilis]MDJ1503566.1 hypothetical protein [Xanthocytophaga agilis]
MCAEYEILFDSNPDLDLLLIMFKQYSGLNLECIRNDNREDNSISAVLTHPELNMQSQFIDIYFVKKDMNGNEYKSDLIVVHSFTPFLNYVEGVILCILRDLGGKFTFEPPLPSWAREKWQGKKWWEKSTSQLSWLSKLIQKILKLG